MDAVFSIITVENYAQSISNMDRFTIDEVFRASDGGAIQSILERPSFWDD
jgi:hypothetical protein